MNYQVTAIKEHWEIRYKDIDPDTGNTIQDTGIAMSINLQHASNIIDALSKSMEDPNRVFYVKKVDEIKVKDIQTYVGR